MSKIQIITGSTRPGRVNPQVAQWIYEITKKRDDLEVEIVDIAGYNLPLLDEPVPPSMANGNYSNEHTKKWSAKISEADGYIFVAPEYNHGIPGALKNAIDFLYNEWNNKAAGFVSYGSGSGIRSVEHLRGVMAELQVADVRSQVMLGLSEDFENYSTLTPRPHQENVANTMLDQLTQWSSALKTVRTA